VPQSAAPARNGTRVSTAAGARTARRSRAEQRGRARDHARWSGMEKGRMWPIPWRDWRSHQVHRGSQTGPATRSAAVVDGVRADDTQRGCTADHPGLLFSGQAQRHDPVEPLVVRGCSRRASPGQQKLLAQSVDKRTAIHSLDDQGPE
jgi:hypothetical protein